MAHRENGVVVLHKDATVSSVDGDTEIVFSTEDLENGSFSDDEVYEYKIVAYSSSDGSEINLATQYFDRLQMTTREIFGMGDEEFVRSILTLYYNGGLYTTENYPFGTTQIQYYCDRTKNFIVPVENLTPSNVVCEGFEPVIVEESYGNRLAFSTANGSSDVIEFSSTESGAYWYIPSSYFENSSSNSKLQFCMMKVEN